MRRCWCALGEASAEAVLLRAPEKRGEAGVCARLENFGEMCVWPQVYGRTPKSFVVAGGGNWGPPKYALVCNWLDWTLRIDDLPPPFTHKMVSLL
jgi:hypothetical protein